ncbi:hypothetical protein L596_020309 [Steinernema carpocapsae]|uniref:Uncharacterized protein n=1 Tax=Steinernema carpocapsae TaxID=34508 RepID=A0A4U5MT48_STECR|nr:hypothetical protein L596_020309 [Steinernema carpocapsae]
MLTPSESSEEAGEPQCPLCMEVLEPDDVHFYPCTCGYQISTYLFVFPVCLFCWHRLRTDGNGRCPACRQDYGEDPVSFKPSEKVEKRINEKAKAKTAKPEAADLSAYRVLQMNLIYVTGLSPRIADVDTLKKNEYFGQFGKILKLSITNGNGGSANLQSACAYVTYSKSDEALRAILSFHNTVIDGRNIKVSLGTTKYCASFLRSQSCSKTDCSYCHEMSDMEISFTAEDMQAGKHSDYEKRLLERFERSLARQAQRQAILAARKVVPTQNPKPEASVEPRIDPPPPAVIAQPSKVEPRVPVANRGLICDL